MADILDFDADDLIDIEIIEEAARRWDQSAAERERKTIALSEGRYHDVEPAGRLAKRLNHLAAKANIDRVGDAPMGLAAIIADGVTESELDDATYEQLLGETVDYLSARFLSEGARASRSVCRIRLRVDGRDKFGTGFLVGPGLLITNWHVLKQSRHADGAVAEFLYEDGAEAVQAALAPSRFFINDRALDFAVCALDADDDLSAFGWLPLIGQEGKISIGEPVNIIQHPRGLRKKIVVRENSLVHLPDAPLDFVAQYLADTEYGASGSPVFNDQWEVVALHHAGVPKRNGAGEWLARNGGVWRKGDAPSEIDWIANEGIRISRIVAALKAMALTGARAKLRNAIVAGAVAPRDTPASTRRGGMTLEEDAMAADDATFHTRANIGGVTLPITVTVTIGASAAAPSGAVAIASDDITSEAAVKPDENYAKRKGYNPTFLGAGAEAALPTPSNTIMNDVVQLEDGSHELKYHHFSVIMSRSRRLAFISAVNFHTKAKVRRARDASGPWYFDPRIDEALQAGNEYYADNPLDRGHLARRADSAWGATEQEARQANDDTFHWTNCAPQHEIFNQSSKATERGLLLWGNLENHIAAEAAADGKVSVFNGPVLARGDRKLDGFDLKLPKRYWKIVLYRSDGGLGAAAFLLTQSDLIADLQEEEFDPGDFAPFQVKVTEIERLTKLDFGDLWKCDPLEAPGAEENFIQPLERVVIRDLADIVV
ncbi:DNA/RNA non-specific endonuclease [Terricaulis silvestris]|uniref:Serine protease n=1 Tax=Terricaulis silvestris TaxID=2686094 RepID=A0A6I6MGB7_9CAUL|nr:DNA/RNA non-specific endonuclease [Terricaulis silvestris]QGZ93640.1 Nuclease precursor [Terricaulis silvestris]